MIKPIPVHIGLPKIKQIIENNANKNALFAHSLVQFLLLIALLPILNTDKLYHILLYVIFGNASLIYNYVIFVRKKNRKSTFCDIKISKSMLEKVIRYHIDKSNENNLYRIYNFKDNNSGLILYFRKKYILINPKCEYPALYRGNVMYLYGNYVSKCRGYKELLDEMKISYSDYQYLLSVAKDLFGPYKIPLWPGNIVSYIEAERQLFVSFLVMLHIVQLAYRYGVRRIVLVT